MNRMFSFIKSIDVSILFKFVYKTTGWNIEFFLSTWRRAATTSLDMTLGNFTEQMEMWTLPPYRNRCKTYTFTIYTYHVNIQLLNIIV